DYGILSVALAFSSVAGYFTDVGLTQTLTREATKKEADLPTLISSFFRVKTVLSILTAVGCFLIIEIFYTDPYVQKIISLVVYPTIIGAALYGPGVAYFQVIEKMKITAIIRFSQGMFTACTLLLSYFFKWPVTVVASVYGVSYIIAGIVTLIFTLKEINYLSGWNKAILNGIYSFTISGLVVMLLPQLGPLILGKVISLKHTGYFSA